jgi:hypothetical protein
VKADQSFDSHATLASPGRYPRASLALALPELPSWGVIFHILSDLQDPVCVLEIRAYTGLEHVERPQ